MSYPGRTSDGHRAVGCLSEQLHRLVEQAAPLDSRRLANHGLAQGLCAGWRQPDGIQSAFRTKSLENLRQSAPEPGCTRNHSSPSGRVVLHTCSNPVERDYRRLDVVAGPECFTRSSIPSAAARNEILA